MTTATINGGVSLMQAPVKVAVTEDKFWFLTEKRALPLPSPFNNQGNYVIRYSIQPIPYLLFVDFSASHSTHAVEHSNFSSESYSHCDGPYFGVGELGCNLISRNPLDSSLCQVVVFACE